MHHHALLRLLCPHAMCDCFRAQFIKYFYEIWNGGMELFTERDFDATIKVTTA